MFSNIGPLMRRIVSAVALFACTACVSYGLDMTELEETERASEKRAKNELVAYMTLDTMFPDRELRALARAAAKGETERIDNLVRNGVDANGRGTSGAVPLYWAMHNIQGFRHLLKLGADPNVIFDDGGSVFHWAVTHKNSAFYEALLEHGADPNLRAGALQWTPLFHVLHGNLKQRVAPLLEAGADIDARDATGMTPLMVAAMHGQFDVVYDLLRRGADYKVTTVNGINLVDVLEFGIGNEPDPGAEMTKWRNRVIAWLQDRSVSGE